MDPRRLLIFALLAEAAVAAFGMAWIQLRALPLIPGPLLPGTVLGAAGAAVLAFVNFMLLRWAPDLPVIRSLRRVYREVFRPLFSRIGVRETILISMAAGVGEELLFRGAVQQEWGLIPASLLFGAAHFGGTGTLGFAVWAAAIGGFLGWLALAAQGLLAPVVAHMLYDALALAYIRWGRELSADSVDPESDHRPTQPGGVL